MGRREGIGERGRAGEGDDGESKMGVDKAVRALRRL